ncbi:chromate efflux transporter [soil metagenome]
MAGRLGELARAFTWLGLTAFGGPAAHIAIMQREFVDRRGWLTHQRFADLIGLSSLLPGPTSTELALGIGYERARWRGLLIAGLGFIVPASLIVLTIAVAYEQLGELAWARSLLYGMAPVVIAVIAHAVVMLAPTAFSDATAWLVGIGAFGASVAGFFLELEVLQPLVVLVAGALVMLAVRRLPRLALDAAGGSLMLPMGDVPLALVAAAGGVALGLGAIFLTFLKMGVVVFGSGYVLVAFLGSELVTPGYITETELLDAIAIGQLTPGPVFTTATFIGYQLAGIPGAVVATVGIVLPSFVLVAMTHPWLQRIRASATLSAGIDGLNAAAIGLIAASIMFLGRDAFLPDGAVDPLAVGLGLGALIILVSGRLGPLPLLLAGGLIGFAAQVAAR